jgi:hypothetical protein
LKGTGFSPYIKLHNQFRKAERGPQGPRSYFTLTLTLSS